MKTILRNFLSVLRRFRMATALNVLGLSVAFAAFLVIMMQVDYDRSFDGSHPGADRIFRLEAGNLMGVEWLALINRPLMDAFIASSPHILAAGYGNLPGQTYFSVEQGGGKNVYLESSVTVSPGYADVFTFDMLEGDAHALGEPLQALIPQSLARKIFGNEPAVGKRLAAGEQNYTVAGVFRDFPRNTSTQNIIYLPIPADENLHDWGNWNYIAYIRLDEPGNVAGLFDNFFRAFDLSALPDWAMGHIEKMNLRFTPLAETHYVTGVVFDQTPKASRQTLLILLGIAFIIVLIAGINYTNFSAALTPRRIRSINTQKVLGGDVRVIRLALVLEAAAIALASFLIALALVALARDTFIATLVEADLSPAAHTALVAFTGGVALVTGLAAGLYPARYMTSFPPALALKGSFGLSPRGRRLRSALICVQFISSFALVIGASFIYLQNYFMQHTALGYEKDQVVVAGMNKNIRKELAAFGNQLKSFAGVEGVTYAQFLLSGGDSFVRWGREYRDRQISYDLLSVHPSFLDVMGIEVSQGRGFRPEDGNTRHGAYIFNEKARATYSLELNNHIDSAVIAGFIPDIKYASLRTEVSPMAFFVAGARYGEDIPLNYAYVRVKAGSDMRAAIGHVRATLREFDSEYPFDVRFFDESLQQTYEKEQKLGRLISLFSLVAILISIVGVFGLVVFDSEYRRKEISLRKIFGSTTGGILILFNKVYLRLLIPCFVVAAPLAWYAVGRWLENFAYRTPLYWWVYLAAFVLVSLLTVATVTFQNWRAANTNPAENIKSE